VRLARVVGEMYALQRINAEVSIPTEQCYITVYSMARRLQAVEVPLSEFTMYELGTFDIMSRKNL
jgi:hypothetical protein